MKPSYNHIDDLLKDILSGYSREPSPGLWRKIAAGLFLRSGGFYLSVIIVLLAGCGLLLMGPLSKPEYNQAAPAYMDRVYSAAGETKKPDVAPESTENERDSNASFGAEPSEANNHEPKINTLMAAEPIAAPDNPAEGSEEPIPTRTPSQATTWGNARSAPAFDRYPGLPRLGDSQGFSAGLLPAPYLYSVLYYPDHVFDRNTFAWPGIPEDYGFKKSNFIMAQVGTEVIFSGAERRDISYTLTTDLAYVREGRDGFLQAGAGLGISEDEGLFNIDYTQYDSIGYYEQVVGFSIDPTSGQPVFQTNTTGVFDTVAYNETASSQNFYYYLRLPVRAGLKFYEAKRLGLYVLAGGTYALLVKKHEPGIRFSKDSAIAMQVVDNTPSRVKSNVQLSLGLGFRYRISNRFDLRLDGLYNYYWNELVERQSRQKSPFSLGLGVGLLYKL